MDEYRPLHWTAVGSIAAGVLSFLASLNYLFLTICFVGVIVSGIGLFILRFSGEKYAGKTLCVIGLSLSVFFATWRVGYEIIRKELIFDQAVARSYEWLEHVKAGKDSETFKAFELSKRYTDRRIPGTDLKEIYTKKLPNGIADVDAFNNGSLSPAQQMEAMGKSPAQEFNAFFSQYPMNVIAKHAATGQIEFVRHEEIFSSTGRDSVSNIFNLTYDEEGVGKELKFRIITERLHYPPPFHVQWRIEGIADMSKRPNK